jgi:hypothetical protein
VGVKRCGRGRHAETEARKKIDAEIEASLNSFYDTEMKPCFNHKSAQFHKSERSVPICCEGGCGCPKDKECCNTASGVACVDLKTDPKNCGSCGKVCSGPNASCVGGTCCSPGGARSGASGSALGAMFAAQATLCCPEGQTECAGGCVDLSTDPDNCGRCGNLCSQGDTCVNGSCQSGGQCQGHGDCDFSQGCEYCDQSTHTCKSTCKPNETCCPFRSNPNSHCVDLSNDSQNCGQCNHNCRTSFCAQGQCACDPGSGYTEPCYFEGEAWVCCEKGDVCCQLSGYGSYCCTPPYSVCCPHEAPPRGPACCRP